MSALSLQPLTVALPARASAGPISPAAALDIRRHRRASAASVVALAQPGQGVAALRRTQSLPFAASASVSGGSGLLYPIVGAVLGTFLLGIPGTILGGLAGFLLAR